MAAALEVDGSRAVGVGRSHSGSFLSNNPQGNTIAGNSYLQTYSDPPPKDEVGTSSTTATAMSIITIMIGAGVLILPQQFNKLGMPLGTLMLVTSCCCSSYLCLTLNEAIGRIQERTGTVIQTLDEIAYECFGTPGKWAAQFILRAFILGSVACYIVLIGKNLEYMCSPPNYRTWVLITSGLFLLTAFVKSVKVLEKVSVIGVVCSFVYAVPVFVASVQAHFDPDIPPAEDMWRLGGSYGFDFPPGQLLPSFAVLLFCYAPIEVIATARRNMADQDRMPVAVRAAHSAVGAFYLLIGVFGAWGFGDTVLGNVTESMQSRSGKWAAGYVLAISVVTNLFVTIPVSLFCFFATFTKSSKMSLAMDSAMRVGVVVFCGSIGLTLPYFMQILQIMSSTLVVPLTIFIPLACGFKSAMDSGTPYSTKRLIFDSVFCVFGVGCFVVGFADAVDDLIKEMAKEGTVQS